MFGDWEEKVEVVGVRRLISVKEAWLHGLCVRLSRSAS